MKKTISALLPLSLVLASCAAPQFDLTGLGSCSQANTIVITAAAAALAVAPPNTCATRGETLSIVIAGGRPRDTVHTIAKLGNPDTQNPGDIPGNWLTRSNDPNPQRFSVTVPNNAQYGQYFFRAKVDGLGELDPMITVED